MAHFGVVAPAFYSHFSAMSALAEALVERGHRVTFMHRPDAVGFIADSRIGFHALGTERFPPGSLAASLRRAANPGNPLGLHKVIVDMAAATDMLCRELPAALRTLRIDAILGDQMEAAAGIISEALRIPFISIACALPVNREAGIPLPVMPFAFSNSAAAIRTYRGSADVYDWIMAPHRRVIRHHARSLGIPARSMLHECLSSLAQISQTTASFDFPRRHLPAGFHHVGPLRPPALTPKKGMAQLTDQRMQVMLSRADDRPLVFASLGTLQGRRFTLFKRIAEACRMLDTRLLVAHCGGLDQQQARIIEAAGTAGATVVCAFVPQHAVLARADAVVSHAGLNTALDAIASRTPILALPIAFDQPGVAARIIRAGIGLRASARFTGAAKLSVQLSRLLTDARYRQQLDVQASDLAESGGAQRAADIVETALCLNVYRADDPGQRRRTGAPA
jgi:zeaxanthin glucosyltransferase